MIIHANQTAVAEAQRRRMVREVLEFAIDAEDTDLIDICINMLNEVRYIRNHDQWPFVRETWNCLID